MWPVVSGFFHLACFQDSSILYRMYQYYIPFYSWIIFHCMHIPSFVHPFICCWTSVLFPCFGYCEYCCYLKDTENGARCWSFDYCFFLPIHLPVHVIFSHTFFCDFPTPTMWTFCHHTPPFLYASEKLVQTHKIINQSLWRARVRWNNNSSNQSIYNKNNMNYQEGWLENWLILMKYISWIRGEKQDHPSF